MTYDQAIEYIHANFWLGSKPGLSRTKELLGKIGNPQDKLSFIHVAGTNGKGSFCAMLSSILIESGYKVGTFTSPYILRFNERMKIGGLDIPDDTLARLTEFIRPFAEEMEDKPTEFELITAIAMEYFAREKCDIVILECGMGGRLDSTNIIKTPLLSVITGIALDHTAFLGNTVCEIATEKAGIIKKNIPCLFCGNDTDALSVIEGKARQMASPLFTVDRSKLTIKESSLDGTVFDCESYQDMTIPLLGTYQAENAQNVLKAVELLQKQGLKISEGAIKGGLKNVRWPARYEIVCRSPLIVCDGGHNPEGVDSAVKSTKHYFKGEKLLVVTGVMADKDHRYIAKRIGEIAKEVFCITPDNPRALSAEEFTQDFCDLKVLAKAYPSVFEAITAATKKAKEEGTAILCLGSLYMYKEIIDSLKKAEII